VKITEKSKSTLAEEAFAEYFQNHGLDTGFVLTVTPTNIVLHETGSHPRVLRVTERNGKTPEEWREHYQIELGDPVKLVVQEE